ncbi:MAG: ACT domain-containing protein [Myxococcota bacterium]|nr:ACT domain-containing protein [Myxococcota bacterium]
MTSTDSNRSDPAARAAGVSLVLTVVCPDRPGVIDGISALVAARHGNWEESRMVRLGGMFAGIARVTVPAAASALLAADLAALEYDGIAVSVLECSPAASQVGHRAMLLHVQGADHEGIVHAIAGFLAGRGVNVEDLATDVVNAPLSGGPLFTATARLRCPPSVAPAELRSGLDDLGRRLGFDVSLSDDV